MSDSRENVPDTHVEQHKPTMGEKIGGAIETIVGKVTKNEAKIEDGQAKKTDTEPNSVEHAHEHEQHQHQHRHDAALTTGATAGNNPGATVGDVPRVPSTGTFEFEQHPLGGSGGGRLQGGAAPVHGGGNTNANTDTNANSPAQAGQHAFRPSSDAATDGIGLGQEHGEYGRGTVGAGQNDAVPFSSSSGVNPSSGLDADYGAGPIAGGNAVVEPAPAPTATGANVLVPPHPVHPVHGDSVPLSSAPREDADGPNNPATRQRNEDQHGLAFSSSSDNAANASDDRLPSPPGVGGHGPSTAYAASGGLPIRAGPAGTAHLGLGQGHREGGEQYYGEDGRVLEQ